MERGRLQALAIANFAFGVLPYHGGKRLGFMDECPPPAEYRTYTLARTFAGMGFLERNEREPARSRFKPSGRTEAFR
jgi:hypothetical protein